MEATPKVPAPRVVLMCEIPKVQFYLDENFLCSGRFVLAEMQESGKRKLRIFGVSSTKEENAFTFAIDEVVALSSHSASLEQLSSITAKTRNNQVYTFIFTEGCMQDVLDVLLHRRAIVHKNNSETDYLVVASDPNLREYFLIEEPFVFQSARVFKEVELGDRFSLEKFNAKIDSAGRLSETELKQVRLAIRCKGIAPDAIATVWCYLLGIFKPGQSSFEQTEVLKEWEKEFTRCLAFLDDFTPQELTNFPLLNQSLRQIQVDTQRTDGIVEFYAVEPRRDELVAIARASLKSNLKVGYCQGMLDCASVFLQASNGDKILAYACYRKFLEFNGETFGTDLSPIKTRLEKVMGVLEVCKPTLAKPLRETQGYFVAHQWMLVWMKRQFPYSVVLSLWTAILNQNYGRDSLYYIIAAIFIAKSADVLAVEHITPSTIYEIYRDVSDVTLDAILTIAKSCRESYIRKTCGINKPSSV